MHAVDFEKNPCLLMLVHDKYMTKDMRSKAVK